MCKDKTIIVDRNSHTLVSNNKDNNACYLILKAKLYRERERESESIKGDYI